MVASEIRAGFPLVQDTESTIAFVLKYREGDSIGLLSLMLLGSAAVWFSLWLLIRRTRWLTPKAVAKEDDRVNWDSRVVSMVHAIVCIYEGGHLFFLFSREKLHPVELVFGGNSQRDMWLMITSGYLLYDFILCLRYYRALGNLLTFVHHVLIIIAFSVGAYTRIGTLYMASFLVNEVSTIFLNLNYFMAVSSAYRGSLLYQLNGVFLLLSFALFRSIQNTIVVQDMIFNAWRPLFNVYLGFPFALQILCGGLTMLAMGHVLLNIVWLFDIAKAVIRKLHHKPTSENNNSKTGDATPQNDEEDNNTTSDTATRGERKVARVPLERPSGWRQIVTQRQKKASLDAS